LRSQEEVDTESYEELQALGSQVTGSSRPTTHIQTMHPKQSASGWKIGPVVPLREPGPGGWKSARVIIRLVHVTERGIERNIECPIEAQVPEINYRGIVTDEFARLEAARAAEMCEHFRNEMEREMGINVDGTRVIQAL
jgi:hypothetical protein